MKKIPVTIITGFLGTGKTTLIKRICTEMVSKRIGVIQNEFSPVMGIEKPILLKSGATVYELPNGCLCCSAKSELVSALESFLQLTDRIDWIIVETSGTSDPLKLTGNLWLDENLESRLMLDGVVSITDVSTVNLFLNSASRSDRESTLYNSNTTGSTTDQDKVDYSELFDTFSKQLSVGDLVVVNKTDLNPLTAELRKYLESFNNSRVAESVMCDFNLDLLFDLGTFESKKLLSFDLSTLDVHKHVESRLKTACIKSSCVYSLRHINDTVASLLWDRNDIYRCKGIFRAKRDCSVIDVADGEERCFELQGVGQVYEIKEIDVTVGENIFLFIGNELDSASINKLISSNH